MELKWNNISRAVLILTAFLVASAFTGCDSGKNPSEQTGGGPDPVIEEQDQPQETEDGSKGEEEAEPEGAQPVLVVEDDSESTADDGGNTGDGSIDNGNTADGSTDNGNTGGGNTDGGSVDGENTGDGAPEPDTGSGQDQDGTSQTEPVREWTKDY